MKKMTHSAIENQSIRFKTCMLFSVTFAKSHFFKIIKLITPKMVKQMHTIVFCPIMPDEI